MYKRLAVFLTLLLCLELTACAPAAEGDPTLSTGSSTELPTEPADESVIVEPPYKGVIAEPSLLEMMGNRPTIIAEILEITTESMVEWGEEFTKVNCRMVYGFKPREHRYKDRVSDQGDFPLYLTAGALQQLGQAEMVLLCSLMYPDEGYAADWVIPIADNCMVLEGEWKLHGGTGFLITINDQIRHLTDKRDCGEELSETDQLAPTSPLETGMTVDEIIAFFDTWGIYWDQASEELSRRRAELYG